MLPNPKKELPCGPCEGSQMHTLGVTKEGTAWTCNTCGNVAYAYSHSEMREMLLRKVAQLGISESTSSPVPDTSHLIVQIEGPDGPIELAPRFVAQHTRVTGKLPAEGEPIYTCVPGLPPALAAVPYGKIVRVTRREVSP